MIYDFHCSACDTNFDIWKPATEFTRQAACECGGLANLVIHAPRGFINEKVEHAEYNPGLGCVVKNRAHRAQIAKAKGLVEVGNETTDTLNSIANESLSTKMKYEAV